MSRKLLLALLLAAGPAGAANLTWFGAGSTNNWSDSFNWGSFSAFPADGDSLTFTGSSRTSPFNNIGGLDLNGILFQAGAAPFTLGGNGFTLNGAIHNSSTSLQTINNAITFSGLAGINTLSGGSAGALAFGGPIFLNSTTLTVGGSHTVTFDGAIGGSSASGTTLNVSGAPLVVLNGSNTYTGTTHVASGKTLRIGASERIPNGSVVSLAGGILDLNGFSETIAGLSGPSGSAVTGGGTLRIAGPGSSGFSGTISGATTLVVAGGSFGLSGTQTYTGGTQVLGGQLTAMFNNPLPDAGAVLVQGGQLTINTNPERTGVVTLAGGTINGTGVLSGEAYDFRSGSVTVPLSGGAGGLEKTTAGMVTLAGQFNSLSGAANIREGTLLLNNATLTSPRVTVFAGATLGALGTNATARLVELQNGGAISGETLHIFDRVLVDTGSINVTLAGGGGLFKQGPGTLTLERAQAYLGPTAVQGGVLAIGASERISDSSMLVVDAGATFRLDGFQETVAGLNGAGNVELGAGRLIVGGEFSEFDGVISGSGGLTKQGGPGMTIRGANTYTGRTEVLEGTLALGAGGVLADTSALFVAPGAFLYMNDVTERVGAITLGGTIWGNGAILLSDHNYEVSSGSIDVRLAGNGSLVKTGPGVVVLGEQAAYTGTTEILEGRLAQAVADALPQQTAVMLGAAGTLDLAERPMTVGSLAGSGTVRLEPGAELRVGGNGLSTTFSGTFGGGAPGTAAGGVLVKTGPGTLTLLNNDEYSGALRVEAGELYLPDGLIRAGGAIEIAGGTLRTRGLLIDRAFSMAPAGTLAASGDLIIGSFEGGESITIHGTFDIGSHRAQLLNMAGASGIGNVRLGEGGRLTVFDQEAGLVLLAGGAVQASGSAGIDGNFVNHGTVHGPTGVNQTLTFTDDVTGPGSYTGNVTFADGFSPGASPATIGMGNVTFDASSSLLMEIGELAHDKLVLSGELKLDGGLLTVALLDGYMPMGGETFDLFDFASIAGEGFGRIALPTLGNGLSWNTASLYDDGTLSVAAIPEPQTYALLLAGLGLFGFVARRRKGYVPIS